MKLKTVIAIAALVVVFFGTANASQQSKPTWSPEQAKELRSIYNEIRVANVASKKAEVLLLEFIKAGPIEDVVTPPVVEPPIVEPPVIEPPVVEPPVVHPPVTSDGTFDDLNLPFKVPSIPDYIVPTIDDCEWVVADGVYTSTMGLSSEASVRGAYRASIAAGHAKPITFGIYDTVGRAFVGGLWNGDADHSITVRESDGSWSRSLSVEFLGLDDECEVLLGWSSKFGFPAYVGAFNIGLRGQKDSFIIRANEGVGRVVIDGCYWLGAREYESNGGRHASGLHIDNWETLIWRNHKWRGEKPGTPGVNLREHSAYLKSCIGTGPNAGTWIVGNDLKGGNRCGFQIRPQRLAGSNGSGNDTPRGPVVIASNVTDGYGWNNGSTPNTFDGGACITVWAAPVGDVYVFNNRITDSKYGCLVLSTQSEDRNFLGPDGYPIKSLYLYGNTFEGRRADRGCVSISSVGRVLVYGGNSITGSLHGDVTLDGKWAMNVGGIVSGEFEIYGREAVDYWKTLRIKTHDPADPRREIAFPVVQLDAAHRLKLVPSGR